MKYKLFSEHTGLHASELILGASMLGTRGGYGASNEDANKILSDYADAGGNFIDIADRYQLGEAEELVGKFIEHKRSNYIICTKYTRSSEVNPSPANSGNHRKAMKQAVEASLRRLKTDYIDIYMPHFDDGLTPIEEIVRGLQDLIREGKILYPGLANFPAWKTAAFSGYAKELKAGPLVALQLEYNLIQREADRDILPMAQHYGLGTMLYSPLAGGVLTGKYRKNEKGRINLTTDYKENEVTKSVLDKLTEIAGELSCTTGQVAMAWVMTKGGFPIVGARTSFQVKESLKAADISLTAEHSISLDHLSKITLGYPHDLLSTVQKPAVILS